MHQWDDEDDGQEFDSRRLLGPGEIEKTFGGGYGELGTTQEQPTVRN